MTHLTLHAAEGREPDAESATPCGERAEGTHSKHATWRDGFRSFGSILRLHMLERPMEFYLTLALSEIAAFVAWRMENSRLRSAWEATRDDADVAHALGLNLISQNTLAHG